MLFYCKNTHNEYKKQTEFVKQIKSDFNLYPGVQISEKVCRVNSYFTVKIPKYLEVQWVDQYFTQYLRLMSRNLSSSKKPRSTVYIDYWK